MESLLSLKEEEQLLSALALRGGGGGGSGEPHLRVPAEITDTPLGVRQRLRESGLWTVRTGMGHVWKLQAPALDKRKSICWWCSRVVRAEGRPNHTCWYLDTVTLDTVRV